MMTDNHQPDIDEQFVDYITAYLYDEYAAAHPESATPEEALVAIAPVVKDMLLRSHLEELVNAQFGEALSGYSPADRATLVTELQQKVKERGLA